MTGALYPHQPSLLRKQEPIRRVLAYGHEGRGLLSHELIGSCLRWNDVRKEVWNV